MQQVFFGKMPDGQDAHLWRIANAHGMTADVTDLGACLVSLRVPDGADGLLDVVLGYDGAGAYAVNAPSFGAVVGRHANRIGGARFELDGRSYELAATERGNNLHSGPDLWSRRRWELAELAESRIDLHLESPDGDQGFPGALDLHVTYELTDDDALAITYAGTPTAPTIVNLTNHSYFNLNGHASGTALNHALQVAADSYTEADDALVPTGRVLDVAGTPLDLRQPRVLAEGVGAGFPALEAARGYDHNFVLDGWTHNARGVCVGDARRVATLTGDLTGIAMDVITDTPGLQVYTANYIEGERGKGGVTYHDHDAVCMETQFFPDAIHHPSFAQPVFGPERPYRSRTTFAFSREG